MEQTPRYTTVILLLPLGLIGWEWYNGQSRLDIRAPIRGIAEYSKIKWVYYEEQNILI